MRSLLRRQMTRVWLGWGVVCGERADGGRDDYGQEKQQVQTSGSKAEQLKLRELLVIQCGKNRGCVWVRVG